MISPELKNEMDQTEFFCNFVNHMPIEDEAKKRIKDTSVHLFKTLNENKEDYASLPTCIKLAVKCHNRNLLWKSVCL
jgi:hypothetical protein